MGITKTIVDQLTPAFGQAKARDIASNTLMVLKVLAKSPLSELEDHVLLPALAAHLGICLGHGRALKMERALQIAAGSPAWPSLLEPDEVLDILALTNVAPAQSAAEEMLQRLMAGLNETDEDAFADMDAEVKG